MSYIKKIFKGNPLKRIEIKAGSPKFRIRASRTSGLNAAIHPLRGLTFNTKHGLRVSKTFRGLTLGFQNGNSVIRGRWSSKNNLLNLNLSKSGFSLSSKSRYGTYNISNPNRSSFKYAGVQIRGKKAAGLALLGSIFTFIKYFLYVVPKIISFIFFLIYACFYGLILLCKTLIDLISIIYNLILFVMIDLPIQFFKINNRNLHKKIIYNNQQNIEKKIKSKLSSSKDLKKQNESKMRVFFKNFISFTSFFLAFSFHATALVLILVIPLIHFEIISWSTLVDNNGQHFISIFISSFICFLIGSIIKIPYKKLKKINLK